MSAIAAAREPRAMPTMARGSTSGRIPCAHPLPVRHYARMFAWSVQGFTSQGCRERSCICFAGPSKSVDSGKKPSLSGASGDWCSGHFLNRALCPLQAGLAFLIVHGGMVSLTSRRTHILSDRDSAGVEADGKYSDQSEKWGLFDWKQYNEPFPVTWVCERYDDASLNHFHTCVEI